MRRESGLDPSLLHHPATAAASHAEFEPLLGLRGVKGYRKDFATERFVLTPEDEHESLRRYVAGLIDHADALARTPVLGFNRTSFRIAWTRRHFGAFNVHIGREPEGIAGSYMAEMKNGNPWFVANWLAILEANRTSPILAPLAAHWKLRSGFERLTTNRRAFYERTAATMTIEEVYFLTYYLWLVSSAHGLSHCDAFIDVNLLSGANYRAMVEQTVRDGCGVDIDLSLAKVAAAREVLGDACRRKIEREVLRIMPREAVRRFIDPAALGARLGGIAPQQAEALAHLL